MACRTGRASAATPSLSCWARAAWARSTAQTDTSLRRDVAIKVFTAADGRATAIWSLGDSEREARAAAALNHPNICTIYEIGVEDGLGFHRYGVP